MKIWTAQQLINEIEPELDVQDDNWVSATERVNYCNEALQQAQRIVHTLHIDYFKKSAFLSMVTNTSAYAISTALPDIYANYIRKIFWSDGGFSAGTISPGTYEVRKIFQDQIPLIEAQDDYAYDVQNPDGATGHQIVIYPPPRETTALKFQIWYIRTCNFLTDLTGNLDIPEGYLFMREFVKLKYMQKDKGNPLYKECKEALAREEAALRITLAAMAPEATQGEIEADFTFYEEMY